MPSVVGEHRMADVRVFELAVEHERERVKLARDEERQHDGLAGLRESPLGPVRRREFELWIHRDGNAAALVAIEVELPADRSRPDAGVVTLWPHWRRKPGLTR